VHPDIDPNWRELCLIHQQKDFCELNGKSGLTIANRGLHEYEAFDEGDQSVLAVTPLRCTGVISQRVIKTRDEMGGWSEEAPDAQCIGSWDFEYRVIPHDAVPRHQRMQVARGWGVRRGAMPLSRAPGPGHSCSSIISGSARLDYISLRMVFTLSRRISLVRISLRAGGKDSLLLCSISRFTANSPSSLL